MNKLTTLMLSLLCLAQAAQAGADESALSTYTEESSSISIRAAWPRLGLTAPDKESDTLVERFVTGFRAAAEQEGKEQTDEAPDMPRHPREMIIESTASGNGRVRSLLWKVYEYTGGAHGNLAVFSRNYTVADGRAVTLNDLFGRPKKALELMSTLSRKKLLQQDLPLDMVEAGTTPDAENFQVFLLEKDGLTVYFNPYQVAPWSEGVPSVGLTLRELTDARPKSAFWK